MVVFVIRTMHEHDKSTWISHELGHQVAKSIKESGNDIVDLAGNDAKRCCLLEALNSRDHKVDAFLIFAHGEEEGDAIRGQCGERPIFDLENASICAEKVVFAFVCYVGKALGKEMVDQGARSFIGFTSKVYIPPSQKLHIGECLINGAMKLLDDPDDGVSAMKEIRRSILKLDMELVQQEPPLDIQLGIATEAILEGLVAYPEENEQSLRF